VHGRAGRYPGVYERRVIGFLDRALR